jgi:hypothetical protein
MDSEHGGFKTPGHDWCLTCDMPWPCVPWTAEVREQLEATADAALNDDAADGLDTFALACLIVDWQLPVIRDLVFGQPQHNKETRMSGAELIANERQRQVDGEGWTPEHDDKHDRGELTKAAVAYALYRPGFWPWPNVPDMPVAGDRDRVRDLVKAGALIAAEIDRLQWLS